MKKFTTIALSAAVAMFAGSAMAQQLNNAQYQVNVEITVEEEVSMWAGHEDVALVMNGADGNNYAGSESSVSHINNVAATIKVAVSGTLPTPIVPGGGINFFIFKNTNNAGAQAAVTANAYNPAGALVWNQASLGTEQTFESVAVSTSVSNIPVVYAAASPGELPLPNSYDLTVLWTITNP